MSDAKAEILGRIKRAVTSRSASPFEDYAKISRDYRRSAQLATSESRELFEDRLLDYGCDIHHADELTIASTVAGILRSRSKNKLLVPAGIPQAWLPSDFVFTSDHELRNSDIEEGEGVITGCSLAIAATGTIALQHSPDNGRRLLTLLPDYHLCIVFSDQIVETVPEAIKRMSAFASAPITTISGPSATSDIEMTRIKGVHGPRILDVLLVTSSQ